MYAELDIDVRWAGEPDVLLKLEPSNKWLMNAVKIGEPRLWLRSGKGINIVQSLNACGARAA